MKTAILLILLSACATQQTIVPEDVSARPEFAQQLNDAIAATDFGNALHIVGCVSPKADSSHYICAGEFSFMTADTAKEKFSEVIQKVQPIGTKVELTAGEGTGSQLMAAFFRGLGAALVAGLTHSSSAGAGIGSGSETVQFTSAR